MLYMFFADGFEEVEAVATLDVIRRAGIEIKSVGVDKKTVKGSHGIEIVCDTVDSDITPDKELAGIILPGGMPGTTNLMNSEKVNCFIDYCYENKLLLAAICAAPMILGKKGLLNGCKAICFPGFEDELAGAIISNEFVCVDRNIITAKGMGNAINFGLVITAYFKGKAAADSLKSTLQCS
ncbi:MAG: DJ-1/PfpI family protein [Ruminococcaceae bacterium]|nr:DJ-1/PfpI family protein [Oscillospiraceae bacterium]